MRTEQVKARLVPAEFEALKALAAAEHRNISETIRELIREGTKSRGLWPPAASGQGGANGRK